MNRLSADLRCSLSQASRTWSTMSSRRGRSAGLLDVTRTKQVPPLVSSGGEKAEVAGSSGGEKGERAVAGLPGVGESERSQASTFDPSARPIDARGRLESVAPRG